MSYVSFSEGEGYETMKLISLFFEPSSSRSAIHSIFASLGDSSLPTGRGNGEPPDMIRPRARAARRIDQKLILRDIYWFQGHLYCDLELHASDIANVQGSAM